MMQCVIVDDEKLSLDLLESNISRVPFLKLAGKFQNPYDAIKFLSNQQADILFVDIEMPGLTGLELLNSIKLTSQVVIVTAYEHYALAGFNLNVTDYLLKPVAFDRFLKACVKCQQQHEKSNKIDKSEYPEYIFLSVDYSQVKITVEEIAYIESMGDYLKIVNRHKKTFITRMSLKSIMAKLNPDVFLRIQKSFIVNIKDIVSIRRGAVIVQDRELPLSQNFRNTVIEKLDI